MCVCTILSAGSLHLSVTVGLSSGYSAFMHPLGSVFLQTLCDLLEMEGGQDLEVTQLLTRLNYRVAYGFEARGPQLAGKKEMPCFVSRLTRQTFPFSMRETELWSIQQYLPDESADETRRASRRYSSWVGLWTKAQLKEKGNSWC